MTSREIINRMGGYLAVAAMLDVKPSCASNWLARGIPARYWPAVVSEAQARGIQGISFETLAAGVKRKKAR